MVDVSVIIAVKNESKYIGEALESIASQENLNFEILVVDDNSTDDTYEIVNSFSKDHSKVSVYHSPSKGKVAAFNFGVKKSTGRYVCLFAGDDIMPKDSLKARLDSIKEKEDHGPCLGLSKIKTLSDNKKLDGAIVPKQKGRGNPSGQSPLMNRSATDILFPIPEHLPNEDTWLEIAICHSSLCKIVHSDIICCLWRIHSGNSYNFNLSNSDFKKKIYLRREAFQLFYDKFFDKLSIKENQNIKSLISLTEAYKSGNILKIINTDAPLKERLRLLGTSNSFFYSIRKFFYTFLSGW